MGKWRPKECFSSWLITVESWPEVLDGMIPAAMCIQGTWTVPSLSPRRGGHCRKSQDCGLLVALKNTEYLLPVVNTIEVQSYYAPPPTQSGHLPLGSNPTPLIVRIEILKHKYLRDLLSHEACFPAPSDILIVPAFSVIVRSVFVSDVDFGDTPWLYRLNQASGKQMQQINNQATRTSHGSPE